MARLMKVIVVLMNSEMDVVNTVTFADTDGMHVDTHAGRVSYVSTAKVVRRMPIKYSGYADLKVQYMAPNSNVVEREVVYSYSLSYTMVDESIRPL